MLSNGFDANSAPNDQQRHAIHNHLHRLAEADLSALPTILNDIAAPDCEWRAAHPMNEMQGHDAALAQIWGPLKQAFPDLERRDLVFVAGAYEGRTFIATLGYYFATMRAGWLGIPASHKTITLRYGEIWEIDDRGRICQANLLWDVLDVMRQANVWPLAPSLGVEMAWPAPFSMDGIRLHTSNPDMSVNSLEQTLQMHKTLAEFDDHAHLSRAALIAMPQKQHWHPKMMWYGPAGIGSTRGLDGFVDGHQLPFRRAFHRPQGSFEEVMQERRRNGAGHYIRIGDGPYSVTGGWPSVYAHHKGGGFCGLPPTGKPVLMRVMDFYLHHEGLIRENWVPLDMLHVLHQMGFDALARMKEIQRFPKTLP